MAKTLLASRQVTVARKGEVRHFELRLPQRRGLVTGIEAGTTHISLSGTAATADWFRESIGFRASPVMGEIRLLELGRGGLFYSGQVRDEDVMAGQGDYSSVPGFRGDIWTHAGKREKDPVLLYSKTGIILGTYQDIYGLAQGQDIQYTVSVHLWYIPYEPII